MTLEHLFNAHTKAIGTLSISSDGRLLLSGGKLRRHCNTDSFTVYVGDDARVVVWNLQTGELMQQIFCHFNGYIASSAWINIWETHELGFVFGCADGSLHIYRQDRQTVLNHTSSFLYADGVL